MPHSADLSFYVTEAPSSEFFVKLRLDLDQLADQGFAENIIAAVNEAVRTAIADSYPTHTVAGSVTFGGGTKYVELPPTS